VYDKGTEKSAKDEKWTVDTQIIIIIIIIII
jgi:hypothetical protein